MTMSLWQVIGITDTSMDYAGFTGSIPKPRQKEKLLQCIANHGLSDTFREQHLNNKPLKHTLGEDGPMSWDSKQKSSMK